MPRFVVITDVHLTESGPKVRSDNYTNAIFEKLQFVLDYCVDNNIQTLVMCGDLLNRSSVSDDCVAEFVEIVNKIRKKIKLKIYTIVGNHDVYGKRTDRLRGKMRLLQHYHWFTIVRDNKIIDIGDGWGLAGVNYRKEREVIRGIEVKDNRKIIVATHAMICDETRTIGGEDVTISYNDIKVSDNVKLVLCGHYHPGFGVVKRKDGVVFANPGALARTSRTKQKTFGPALLDCKVVKTVKCAMVNIPCNGQVFKVKTEVDYIKEVTNKAFIESMDDLATANAYNYQQIAEEAKKFIGKEVGDLKITKAVVTEFIEKLEEAHNATV